MQLSGKHDCERGGSGFEEENGETQVNDNTASGVHALVSYANDVPTDASSRENPEYLYESKLFPINESFHRSVECFSSDVLSAASFDNRVKQDRPIHRSRFRFSFTGVLFALMKYRSFSLVYEMILARTKESLYSTQLSSHLKEITVYTEQARLFRLGWIVVNLHYNP